MLPPSMRVPISGGESLMPETTYSRYPRLCPLLRNVIQWTMLSDSCLEEQVRVRVATHLRFPTCVVMGVLQTSGAWGGGGWKVPALCVFFPTRHKKRHADWMVLRDSMAGLWNDFSQQVESKWSLPFSHSDPNHSSFNAANTDSSCL